MLNEAQEGEPAQHPTRNISCLQIALSARMRLAYGQYE